MIKKQIVKHIIVQYRLLMRSKRTANIFLSIIVPIAYILLMYVKHRRADFVLAFIYMLPYIFYCPLSFSWDSSFFKSIILIPNKNRSYIAAKVLTPISINLIILLITLPPLVFFQLCDILFVLSSNLLFIGIYSFIGTLIATTNFKYIDLNINRSKSFGNFSFLNIFVIVVYLALYCIPVLGFELLHFNKVTPYFFIAIGFVNLLFSKFWINNISTIFEKNKLNMINKFEDDRY